MCSIGGITLPHSSSHRVWSSGLSNGLGANGCSLVNFDPISCLYISAATSASGKLSGEILVVVLSVHLELGDPLPMNKENQQHINLHEYYNKY